LVNGQQKERLTIIPHSGDYGRAACALSIALAV
jgi:peroxiredoxin family protein